MTIQELSKIVRSRLEVKSGYNGKLLCKAYDEKKHPSVSEREVLSIWSEIRAKNSGYGSFSTSVICAYVDGLPEYAEENNNRRAEQEDKP